MLESLQLPEERRTAALARLETDGFLEPRDGAVHPTRAWQAAMARAAFALFQEGEPWRDLRLPIAAALSVTYPAAASAELADLVEVMLPIEARELVRGWTPGVAGGTSS